MARLGPRPRPRPGFAGTLPQGGPADLCAALEAWYGAHRRDLPWRRTADPYSVWVSEIMLQQTTVAAVIPYFQRWMERFPTLADLAGADEQDVLAHWAGLGYYRRARLLHAAAKWAVEHGVPGSAEEWLQAPGVGRYTAGAISSIAQCARAPLVDGNVARVYSRLMADESADPLLTRRAWVWAEEMIAHPAKPGDWNQALMELGATICLPRNPACGTCPVSGFCLARRLGREGDIPTPKAKTQWKRQTHAVWIVQHSGRLGVRQIPPGEWWEGMWEFPRAVGDGRAAELEAALMPHAQQGAWPRSCGAVRHVVTNHKIVLEVSVLELSTPISWLEWRLRDELGQLPMPAPQRRALELAAKTLGWP